MSCGRRQFDAVMHKLLYMACGFNEMVIVAFWMQVTPLTKESHVEVSSKSINSGKSSSSCGSHEHEKRMGSESQKPHEQ